MPFASAGRISLPACYDRRTAVTMARAIALTLLATVLFASPQQTKHRKKPASSGASVKHGKTRLHSRVHKPAAPSYQLHPDPERYQQIQQALADRGYFKGTVNGQWSDDSVDALKRFQTDQKLDADGKINALSLTGLGLGPRHDGSTAGTVPLSATDSALAPPDPTPTPAAPPSPPQNPDK